MKTRSLARRLAAVVAVATAVLASSASGQLPVALDAQVVPIAPPVAEATYPAHDFGGTYVNYSDDRGLTWKRVTPLTPLVNGEGTITMAPGGDVVGVGWDPYSGDHLQAYKYEAETGKWRYTEVPVHQPFYDREWVAVVPGPFTIDGETVEYVSFLKGGWPSKELWYWSTDGLNYTQVSSKIVDKTLSGAAARTLATTARSDADWNQANTNGGMTTLGDHALLAAPDYP